MGKRRSVELRKYGACVIFEASNGKQTGLLSYDASLQIDASVILISAPEKTKGLQTYDLPRESCH